jgi:hypothetical protein
MDLILSIIIAIPLSIFGLYKLLKDCVNPEYESWLIQDKAKYPELYN